MAAAMSAACGFLRDAEADRVRQLIERAGLPTRIDSVTTSAALDHMKMDKKVLGGRLRLVLLRGIGEAFVTADYTPEALTRTLATHLGGAR
jgi:3-dehydroquinate synthase